MDEARRRLLRAGAYAVPAVLSVVVVRHAQANPSCGPVTMGMTADMLPDMAVDMQPNMAPDMAPGSGGTGGLP